MSELIYINMFSKVCATTGVTQQHSVPGPNDDMCPYVPYLLDDTQVMAIVKLFVKVMGTDIMTLTKKNCLWHTGNPRKFPDDSNTKECMPWEYVLRVATARSVGQGCANPQWYYDAARDIVDHSGFAM